MSNRSEQPQRIEGGIAEAIRQEIVPAGTSEETKEFLEGIDCDKALKCGRCKQYDIALSWGEELEDKPGWFQRIATCKTCHLTWCCAFMVRKVINGGANEYISGVCPYCGFTTEQSSKHEELLIHHISTEHPHSAIPMDNPSGQAAQEKIKAAFAYRCVFCTFRCPSKEILVEHYGGKHPSHISTVHEDIARKMVVEIDRESFAPAYTKAEVEVAIRDGYLSFLATFGVKPMSSGWSREIFEGLIVHILKTLTKEGE